MNLISLRIENFQCFGPQPQLVTFENTMTMVIGPNGAGKTAVLQALGRLFDAHPGRRRIRKEDFHVPASETIPPQERKLSIEADFQLPEASGEKAESHAIPPCFNHMRLEEDGASLRIRYRLEASMGQEGDIEEALFYVLGKEENGTPKLKKVPRPERNHIAVYYLPAKREPIDHIGSGTAALLGRIIRAVDWSTENQKFEEAAQTLTKLVTSNAAVAEVNTILTKSWSALHKGNFFKDATVIFGLKNLAQLVENLTIEFNPAHASHNVDYSLLSDGQKSLLYLSLVVTYIEIGRLAMTSANGDATTLHLDVLNPPVFSIIALEEPENSLSPHYLGRINSLLKATASSVNAQAIVTTHSSAILKRVAPEQVRYIRNGSDRTTTVKPILLPPSSELDAYKYLREGLLSNPEIYFARVVVLGEGASEDIVLPKLFEAAGFPLDENGVVFSQLGGRHVNYLWRVLTDLQIPFVTLIDLDLARNQGGWGRVRYLATQLNKIGISTSDPESLPKWNALHPLDGHKNSIGWLDFLAKHGIFFSQPLDLDFSMIQAFAKAYGVDTTTLEPPDETTYKSVLGKSHADVNWFTEDQRRLFSDYHALFKVGSKPASHIAAMANLSLEEISASLPVPYGAMIDFLKNQLSTTQE